MSKFYTNTFGDRVDLEDEETFNDLPDTITELEGLMFRDIGFILTYMDYIKTDEFKHKPSRTNYKRKNVEEKIKNFIGCKHLHADDELWFKQRVYVFQDTIDEMH